MVVSQQKEVWLTRMYYRMRMASFALVFVATCLQIQGHGYGVLSWSYLIGLLLVYPHVQYWFARRAKVPVSFAMRSLLLDSVLLGGYCACVGFADWLTFSVTLGSLSNYSANKGWKRSGENFLGLVIGALLGVALGGFHFSPETAWPAAVLCMLSLGWYILAVGNVAFHRNAQLRMTREQLKSREIELLQANDKLQTTLAEVEILRKGLVEQTNRDPLTDLFNRRYLDSTLQREIARCARESRPLALIMLDIDHFKKFNDHYGHQAGDECLKAVSLALQASAKRASDLAARYGGEEFSLVLPDTDAVQARRMAEELRGAIQSLGIAHDGSPSGVVTASVGLAITYGADSTNAESLIRAADDALYYAKWGGRNRVQMAPKVFPEAGAVGYAPEDIVDLVWQPSYACGHAEIDLQHTNLFAQVNRIYAAIKAQQPRSEVAVLMDNLVRHVAEHFEAEEQVFAGIGFPGLQEHARLHQHLIGNAVDLIGRYRNQELPIGDLLRFLSQDLIGKHILGADHQANIEAGFIGLQTP